MKFSEPTQNSAAEEQASLWAARLEGSTLDASDRAALEVWLSSNPAHRALLSEYCQFSADLEQQLPAVVSAGTVKVPALARPSPRSRFSWVTLAGSTLAAVAAAAGVFWIAQPSSGPISISTSVAQRQSVTLGDGTKVELNAQTNLLVEQTRNERHVRLASGEAFFSVAKDTSRPFIVETPTGSVRVTGTVFDVRTDKVAELDVTVVEGSVQVRPSEAAGGTGPRDPSALKANDALVASAGTVTRRVLTADALQAALAWRQGKIVFDHVPLRSAAARFAQYHGVGIAVSPGAANLVIGGSYALDDLDGFFNSVALFQSIRVDRDASGVRRVSLRSEP